MFLSHIEDLFERNLLNYKNSIYPISNFGIVWELTKVIESQISSKEYGLKFSIIKTIQNHKKKKKNIIKSTNKENKVGNTFIFIQHSKKKNL